jgi:hypothetical protein
MATMKIRARHWGGTFPLNAAGNRHPVLQVVHSAETPLRTGYAQSIARNWFAASAPTSAHWMVDPRDAVLMVARQRVAWHCGTGNHRSLGYEQAGYASFTRRTWTTEDAMAQLDLLAQKIAEDGYTYGIPARWATDAQIRDAHHHGAPGGMCTHDDMRRVVGGTTHTDPGDGYPRDLLLERVVAHRGGATAVASSLESTAPPTLLEELEGMTVYSIFFVDGVHHVANHLTNQWARVPGAPADTSVMDAWKIQKDRAGVPVKWHDELGAKSREVDMPLAFGTETTWEKL